MNKTILIISFLLLLFSCKKVQKISNNNQKLIVKYYNKIDKLNKLNNDSLNYYLLKIQKLSINESVEYCAISKTAEAIIKINTGNYDLSIKNSNQSLQLLKYQKNDTLKAKNYNCLGTAFSLKGDLLQSLKYYYSALKIYEKFKIKNGLASTNIKIAEVYLIKNDDKNTINFLNKSLEIFKNEPENPLYLIASHSMANTYGMAGNFKSALDIDNKSLKICDKIKSTKLKAMFLDNKANCYMYSNKLDSAKIYFDKCLILDKLNGTPKQIADNYNNQAILATMKNDFSTAEKYALESIVILKSVNNKANILNSYSSLSDIYEKQGNLAKALETKDVFFTTYKEMINDKKEAATAEFQEIYESDKKEKQIIAQQADAKQKNFYLVGLSILAVFIGIIGFLIFKQQKQKNQQQAQENQLKTAIAEIENQNKLQEQRLSISRDLHDNIGAQLTFIISSVDNVKYGFDITNKKLDDKLTNISGFAKDTIVELRDTIWAMNSNAITFEDLEARINNYIEKAKVAQDNISFSFAIDTDLKTQKLSSVEGMNIYRTIQEAVNNSLKYATANIISINAKKVDNLIKITISDNGKGFNIDEIEKGNGLNNMKKRIEEIGGKFELNSNEDGTKIVVLI